jgi:hypothetical protein
MCEEKHQRTWEAQLVPRSREVSEADIKTGKLMTSWESDQLILLGDGRAAHKGKGLT